MSDVQAVLEANRTAVDDLIAAAERAEANWTTPRAPGKWSPSQVVEHVAIILEEGANVVAGTPSKFPSLPFFLRPLFRGLFFRRVMKKGAFSNSKTFAAFDPASGPLSANVRETRSTQRIRVGRRQRKRTCWDCEREWKRMVVPLESGRPSEARQLLRTRR